MRDIPFRKTNAPVRFSFERASDGTPLLVSTLVGASLHVSETTLGQTVLFSLSLSADPSKIQVSGEELVWLPTNTELSLLVVGSSYPAEWKLQEPSGDLYSEMFYLRVVANISGGGP